MPLGTYKICFGSKKFIKKMINLSSADFVQIVVNIKTGWLSSESL